MSAPRRLLLLIAAVALVAWTGPATSNAAASGNVRVDQAGACSSTSTPAGQLVAAGPRVVRTGMDPSNVSVSPPGTIVGPTKVVVDRALHPGDAFTCQLTVHNRRPRTTTIALLPAGARVAPDGGVDYVSVDAAGAAAGAADWIDPVVSHVTLPPRGYAVVPVVVTVAPHPPPDAAYAAVEFAARLPQGATGGQTAVHVDSRAAVPFLLRVGGHGQPALRLEHVAAPRIRWDRAQWPWSARVVDAGTLHATPRGRLRVRSIFGSTVAQLPLATLTLLPGGHAPLAFTWQHVPWFGLYRWDARIGDTQVDGSGAGSTATSGWFVALPPWWVLALIVLAVIGAVVRSRRRRDHDELDDGTSD